MKTDFFKSDLGRVYNELDLIFGDRPSTQPIEVLDSAVQGEEEESASPAGSQEDDGERGDLIPESLPPTTPDLLPPTRTPESRQSRPTSSTPGEGSSSESSASSTENTRANKSSGSVSAKTRKRKSKMEATLEVFAEKIGSALNQDDTEFQLKMQKAQHEHEMRMFSMLTQFMGKSNQPLQPPFSQPLHLSNFRPPPPQPSYNHFTQPPFGETSNQPLSFLQDLAQAPPFNHAHAHSPDLAQPFSQAPAHPRDLVQRAPLSQASAYSAEFYQPPDEEED